MIRRVSTFGMILMKLDLRQVCAVLLSEMQLDKVTAITIVVFGFNFLFFFQESCRHSEALDAVTKYLDMGTYSEWDEEKKLEFLTRELKGKRPLVPHSMEVGCDFHDML